MAIIIICILLDAALIPLIEDLFKELAMIEACNKVRKENCETWHYSHCEKVYGTSGTELFRARTYQAPKASVGVLDYLQVPKRPPLVHLSRIFSLSPSYARGHKLYLVLFIHSPPLQQRVLIYRISVMWFSV